MRPRSKWGKADQHITAIEKQLKRLHSWQVDHEQVKPILKRFVWKIPSNVEARQVARWHFGSYYGYGSRGLWIPLNSMGGMATKAFDTKTVKFPKRVENALLKLLESSRAASRQPRRERSNA